MAVVGEASAIINLIAIAPQLSKAVIQAASNYSQAKTQIESFGREVCMLGEILGQLRDVLFPDNNKSHLEPGVKTLLGQILDECSGMFSQLDGFSDRLHAKPNALQSVNRRGKMKWVLGDKTELEYLRARVDSMKINISLMMNLQSLLNHKSSDAKADENAKEIMELSQKNEACVKRLQMLENEGAHVEEHVCGKISSSMSVMSAETAGTAGSVQSNSTWNSIFRAYGWEIQKDEVPSVEEAKSWSSTDEELDLCGIGGHEFPGGGRWIKDGELEKLCLFPSILAGLDGDKDIPAWLAQDPPPDFSKAGVRLRADEKRRRLEEADAGIAWMKKRQ